jgi:hypothetical protein
MASRPLLRTCNGQRLPPRAIRLRALVEEVRAEAAVDLAADTDQGRWFDSLPDEQKDEVVDYALSILARETTVLELQANCGNNDDYYELTLAIARSGAPQAEEIFVKYAFRRDE